MAAPAGQSELLRMYLEEGPAPCPGCRYDLRGVQDGRCPECGRELALALVGRRERAALWFVLLALGWVLLAGGMGVTRTTLQILDEAQAPMAVVGRGGPVVVMPQGGQGGTWTTSVAPRGGGGVAVGGGGRGGGAAPVAVQARAGSVQGSTTITINGRPVVFPNAAAPATGKALVWGNVAVLSWINLGWWALLAFASLLALLALLLVRLWGGVTDAPRRMFPFAAVLFLFYAGYQIFLFTTELWG